MKSKDKTSHKKLAFNFIKDIKERRENKRQ